MGLRSTHFLPIPGVVPAVSHSLVFLMSEEKDVFLRKIADGKLLLKFSYMTFNVTCVGCGSEQKLTMQGMADTLKHKSWCVVLAARKFFAGFRPSDYPRDLRDLPVWGMSEEEGSKFAWFEGESVQDKTPVE